MHLVLFPLARSLSSTYLITVRENFGSNSSSVAKKENPFYCCLCCFLSQKAQLFAWLVQGASKLYFPLSFHVRVASRQAGANVGTLTGL